MHCAHVQASMHHRHQMHKHNVETTQLNRFIFSSGTRETIAYTEQHWTVWPFVYIVNLVHHSINYTRLFFRVPQLWVQLRYQANGYAYVAVTAIPSPVIVQPKRTDRSWKFNEARRTRNDCSLFTKLHQNIFPQPSSFTYPGSTALWSKDYVYIAATAIPSPVCERDACRSFNQKEPAGLENSMRPD